MSRESTGTAAEDAAAFTERRHDGSVVNDVDVNNKTTTIPPTTSSNNDPRLTRYPCGRCRDTTGDIDVGSIHRRWSGERPLRAFSIQLGWQRSADCTRMFRLRRCSRPVVGSTGETAGRRVRRSTLFPPAWGTLILPSGLSARSTVVSD